MSSRVPSTIHGVQRDRQRRADALLQALDRGRYEGKVEGVRQRLEEAGRRYIEAARELEVATRERDEAIIDASRHRLPRRYVAIATGLTPGRVQQILEAAGVSTTELRLACSRCGSKLALAEGAPIPPCPRCGSKEWVREG